MLAVDKHYAFCAMENSGKRALIKYLHMKGISPKEINEDMKNILGDKCFSYSADIKNALLSLSERNHH